MSPFASDTTLPAMSGVALPTVGEYNDITISAFALHSVNRFSTNVTIISGVADKNSTKSEEFGTISSE
jgi:hypothetical protein